MSDANTTTMKGRGTIVRLVVLAAAIVMTLSACDWATFHHDVAHGGFTFDVGPADPGGITTRFVLPTGGPVFSSPVIANGVGYVASLDSRLYAFDPSGRTNCSGSPATCAPLWTGVTNSDFEILSSPTVDNGIVYVGSDDNFVYAFDAAGNTNCSGTPKICSPLFADRTSSTVRSSPTVVDGVLYIGSVHDTIEAFDATGNTNCSGMPKVCSPIWSGPTPGIIGVTESVPAVANGFVYIGSRDGNVYAFDAAGNTGCAGTPKVCSPIFIAPAGGDVESSPTISDGVMYIVTDKLYAFDAAGISNCSSVPTSPRVCTPLWTGRIGTGGSSTPAVAHGLVYVGGDDGHMYAFDSQGISPCDGAPRVCSPVWTGQTSGINIFLSSPAVVGNVLYIGSFHDLDAFDTQTGALLGHITTGGFVESSPAVSNGLVYIGSGDNNLYAIG